jgi:N-acetyl-anhydromuramyl-L-alanine amidase AmpD
MDVFKRGDKGSKIADWQRFLNEKLSVGLSTDGDFGPKTETATKVFQASVGLPATGLVDATTLAAAVPSPPTLPETTTFKFVQARNYTKANRTALDLIVIHTMESPEKGTTAENVAAWFAGPTAPNASAHYCVDQDSVVQCVKDSDVAWHAPGANHNGIGIEHAGYAKQTPEEWADPASTAMLLLSAKLVAGLCKKYGIPMVRLTPADLKAKKRGLCGHIDITNAFNGGKGHWDPGPNFPWVRYVEMILAAS